MLLSLIVPSRGRPAKLRRFLATIAATVARPESVEVVLVIDNDDDATASVADRRLNVRRVPVEPGQTMGALNQAGYEASIGRYVMLLNDDVLARTRHWDRMVLDCFHRVPDDILLVHVNDWVFQNLLCTFPIVSRKFCELAGGICPKEYRRYCIDDHIEDHFNMLHFLGERRGVYLPNVVFEHLNYVPHPAGIRQYFSADDAALDVDAAMLRQLAPSRQVATLRILRHIRPATSLEEQSLWRQRLAEVSDPIKLRVPERLYSSRSA